MLIENASGTKGHLLWTGETYIFRVYKKDFSFTDYNIRHNDLEVTISLDDEAAFYYPEEREPYLDHAPMTLGIDGQFDDPCFESDKIL